MWLFDVHYGFYFLTHVHVSLRPLLPSSLCTWKSDGITSPVVDAAVFFFIGHCNFAFASLPCSCSLLSVSCQTVFSLLSLPELIERLCENKHSSCLPSTYLPFHPLFWIVHAKEAYSGLPMLSTGGILSVLLMSTEFWQVFLGYIGLLFAWRILFVDLCNSIILMVTMVTIGGDLQPGCLADRLLTGLGQPQINP
jgi:hypothetical protein